MTGTEEWRLSLGSFTLWNGILRSGFLWKKEFRSVSEEEKRKLATSRLGAPVPTRLVRVVIMANIRAS